MHRTLSVTAAVLALALPAAGLAAAPKAKPKPKPKVTVATMSFKGDIEPAGDFGQVRVVLLARKTTTIVGAKTTVTKKIVQMSVPVWPQQAARSLYISEESIPVLEKEAFAAIKANSTQIDMVSGATYTSQAFAQSFQSAILQERGW
jgi:hypothetical protein